MVEMEESFGALVSQLPSDTEVPGLLEDITNKGLLNGLNHRNHRPEQRAVAKEFYVELPISIIASGSYHDLGAFISGMAGLPRIVTLHDFSITGAEIRERQRVEYEHHCQDLPLQGRGGLSMYRYLSNSRLALLTRPLALVLLRCGSGIDFSDLDAFMAEKRARPGGIIAPIPTFKAYEAFAYSATTLRSPFDRPIEVREIAQLQAVSDDQAR